jgi:hypothetical protein
VLSALLTLYEPESTSTPANERRSLDLSSAEPTPRDGVRPPRDGLRSRASTISFDTMSHAFGLGNARPPAQRNGAGVFGALIASTGNIAGAAAPAANTVAPNLKRPGYHLSRYSHDGNAPDQQSSGPIGTSMSTSDLRRSSRPHSMYTESPLHREISAGTYFRSEPSSPGESVTTTATHSPEEKALRPARALVSDALSAPSFSGAPSAPTTPGGSRRKPFTAVLKDLPMPQLPRGWPGSAPSSVPGSPTSDGAENDGYFKREDMEKHWAREADRERKKAAKRKRRKAEIFVRILP